MYPSSSSVNWPSEFPLEQVNTSSITSQLPFDDERVMPPKVAGRLRYVAQVPDVYQWPLEIKHPGWLSSRIWPFSAGTRGFLAFQAFQDWGSQE